MTDKADLYPSDAELAHIRHVAAGHQPPDLVIRGARVLSPATEEWLDRDVVIAGRHIATLTPWGHFPVALDEIDATGSYVVPGYIDAHLHIEYAALTPGELARVSVPQGTTTVLTDPNGSANVWGTRGMDFMLSTQTPFHVFQQVSPTTPALPHLERGGAVIEEQEVRDRLPDEVTVTLGEGNPFDYGDVSTGRFRAALAAGRRITGHTAAQTHESLWGYLAAGVGDDHNSVTIDEVLERVRLGAMITIMCGTLTDNTQTIFSDLDKVAPAMRHLCFCADDTHALDFRDHGHIDRHIRNSIALGVDPIQAYRMATAIPAAYYRLDQVLGILAPSRLADLLIIPDLATAKPSTVLVEGAVVARDNVALFENRDVVPDWARNTIHLPETLDPAWLEVRGPATEGVAAGTAKVRAMEMYNGYFKHAFTAELPVADGLVQSDPTQDVLKIAVLDRHYAEGHTGVGFVKGFKLDRGAIAISLNCPNMNISVVGTNDADMLAAVERIRELQGGFVTVVDGEVVGEVPLPVGGMVSDAPFEQTAAALEAAHAATQALGCELASPYMILSFVGLAVVPDMGITEKGLIDTYAQDFVDVLLPVPTDHTHEPDSVG